MPLPLGLLNTTLGGPYSEQAVFDTSIPDYVTDARPLVLAMLMPSDLARLRRSTIHADVRSVRSLAELNAAAREGVPWAIFIDRSLATCGESLRSECGLFGQRTAVCVVGSGGQSAVGVTSRIRLGVVYLTRRHLELGDLKAANNPLAGAQAAFFAACSAERHRRLAGLVERFFYRPSFYKTIHHLAACYGCHPKTLSVHLRDAHWPSGERLLTWLRLFGACALLQDGRPSKSAARAVGFPSVAHLSGAAQRYAETGTRLLRTGEALSTLGHRLTAELRMGSYVRLARDFLHRETRTRGMSA